jgi:hypothetical protein
MHAQNMFLIPATSLHNSAVGSHRHSTAGLPFDQVCQSASEKRLFPPTFLAERDMNTVPQQRGIKVETDDGGRERASHCRGTEPN